MSEWLRANGGGLALVVVGGSVAGITNRWFGYALIAVGLLLFVGSWLKRRVRPSRDDSTASQPELASVAHRTELANVLVSLGRHIEADRPCELQPRWQEAVRAHCPDLIRMVGEWNAVAAARLAAPLRIRERFDRELRALKLPDEFDRDLLAQGFGNLTAHRSLTGQLSIRWTHEQMWDVFRPKRPPVDGVHLKRSHDLVISLPILPEEESDEEYNRLAIERIEQVEPLFWEAQDWLETHDLERAERALIQFDRIAVFEEIERLNAPERIRAAEGCPICGAIG